MTRYISLAEYFWLAEQVTGTQAAVLAKVSRVDLADIDDGNEGDGEGDGGGQQGPDGGSSQSD